MQEEESQLKNFFNDDIKDALEIETTIDFAKKVMDEIHYKKSRNKQIKNGIIIISILVFFLFCVIGLYYFESLNYIQESINTNFSLSIWRYKYIPITILTSSIILLIEKLINIKTEKI